MGLKKKAKPSLFTIGCILFSLLAIVCVMLTVHQKAAVTVARPASRLPSVFVGQYRIGDGPWQDYREGAHISATRGDVTLKGQFYVSGNDQRFFLPQIPINFFLDHLSCEILNSAGELIYVSTCENVHIGNHACGAAWNEGFYTPETEDDQLQIILHNPHKYGNENAVDVFLSQLSSDDSDSIRTMLIEQYKNHFTIALSVIVLSLILLGISVFALFLRIPQTMILWLFTAVSISAGGWFFFSSEHAVLMDYEMIANTVGNMSLKMLYGFFICALSVYFMNGKCRRMGNITLLLLGLCDSVLFLLPAFGKINIYDMLPCWVLVQGLCVILLMVCNGILLIRTKTVHRLIYAAFLIAGVAALGDILATYRGWWESGLASQTFFVISFFITIILELSFIPRSIRGAMRARELEKELEDSRISTMISQIQPHFIYNTLTTIGWLCKEQPEKAAKLTEDFSLYLRGNFNELTSRTLVPLSHEIKHIEHYIHIENVRFPDMNIRFQIDSSDFMLPALSIQPLVENAIKHGLMKLEKGGNVTIHTYETEHHYCADVTDDGVGFSPAVLEDDKKHLGIRNIRSRLRAMCGGTLTINSTPGAGTAALIRIPKEDAK